MTTRYTTTTTTLNNISTTTTIPPLWHHHFATAATHCCRHSHPRYHHRHELDDDDVNYYFPFFLPTPVIFLHGDSRLLWYYVTYFWLGTPTVIYRRFLSALFSLDRGLPRLPDERPCCKFRTCIASPQNESVCGSCSSPSDGILFRKIRRSKACNLDGFVDACSKSRIG